MAIAPLAYDVPTITILLLGDAEVGKSTFLSRLTLGHRPRNPQLPPYDLPTLKDGDQPFVFDIAFQRRPYRFEFFDTASPTNYTLLEPDLIILCFDISRRSTLDSLRGKWNEVVEGTLNVDERRPVMILGLKRDIRKAWTEQELSDHNDAAQGELRKPYNEEAGHSGAGGLHGGPVASVTERSVMPEEGLACARALRADLYAECSAVTGELCREVLEDITKRAAKTLTEEGGRSEQGCRIM